jgi:hypothetical protein
VTAVKKDPPKNFPTDFSDKGIKVSPGRVTAISSGGFAMRATVTPTKHKMLGTTLGMSVGTSRYPTTQ